MNKYEKVELIVNRMIENGVIPMSDYDYSVCNFVCDNLDDIPLMKYKEKKLNINQICMNSVNSFTIYDNHLLIDKIVNILKNITIYIDKSNSDSTISNFRSNISTSKRDGNNYFVPQSITIPENFNDLASLYFGHEIHHILKDVNPDEYKNMLLYADVIPMFYELIQSDLYDDVSKKAIINNRLALLSNLKRFVTIHNTRNDSNYITNVIDSKRCQYLNSFYYSLMLYRLYNINPQYVLNIVKKVLMGDMTTDTMIDIFGFHDRSLDNDVIDELNKIKRF